MLGKFKTKGWVLPLAAHCAVQALFTLGRTLFFVSPLKALGLALLDLTVHFIMDRIKASPDLLGRWQALSKGEFQGVLSARGVAADGIKLLPDSPAREECKKQVKDIDLRIKHNTYFWWSLGVDQTVHGITDIIIIYLMLN